METIQIINTILILIAVVLILNPIVKKIIMGLVEWFKGVEE